MFATALKTEDPKVRRRTMDEIKSALEHHTAIEEEIFYPAVRELGTKKAEDMIGEAYEEHHVVKLVLAELPNVDPSDDAFEYKMTVLKSRSITSRKRKTSVPDGREKLGDQRNSELAQPWPAPAA
jgi:hypothetical protein